MNFKQKGFSALIVIVIVAATAFIVAISVSFLGREELWMNLTKEEALKSTGSAEACLQEALLRMKQNQTAGIVLRPNDYSSEAITFNNGDCKTINFHYQCFSDNKIDDASYISDYGKSTKIDFYKIQNINTTDNLTINYVRVRAKASSKNKSFSYYNGNVALMIKNGSELKEKIVGLSAYCPFFCTGNVPILDLYAEWKTNPFLSQPWTRNDINELQIGVRIEPYSDVNTIYIYDIFLEVNIDYPVSENASCSIDISDSIPGKLEQRKVDAVSKTYSSALQKYLYKKIRAIVDITNLMESGEITLKCMGEGDDACQ